MNKVGVRDPQTIATIDQAIAWAKAKVAALVRPHWAGLSALRDHV